MRRVIFGIGLLILLFVNVKVYAVEPDEYELDIYVYDVEGNPPLDLENVSYQIRTGGDSSYNRTMTYNLETGRYDDGTYKVTSRINSSVMANRITVNCETTDNFNIMVAADMGSYHFHIEENIPPLSQLKKRQNQYTDLSIVRTRYTNSEHFN